MLVHVLHMAFIPACANKHCYYPCCGAGAIVMTTCILAHGSPDDFTQSLHGKAP